MFKLVLFLLLGAVVNVAVAWGCSLLIRELPVVNERYPNAADAKLIWSRYSRDDWPKATTKAFLHNDGSVVVGGDLRETIRFGVSHVMLTTHRITVLRADHWFVNEIRAGWPAASFRGAAVDTSPPAKVESVDGFVVTVGTIPAQQVIPRRTAPVPDERLIPYGPLWGGLAINTLFYAVILWAAPLAYTMTRRFIRYQVGRCPMCGYDLRESGLRRARYMLQRGCPECGWRREAEG